MTRRWTWAVPALALVCAACGGGSGSPSAASSSGGGTASSVVGCDTSGAAATATTANYRYVLDVLPVGAMYGPAPVPTAYPSGAVVMFGGAMTTADGPQARDVQVHICLRGNNHVLLDAAPKITLKDTTAGTTQQVPIATMQSATAGQPDYHYGNNLVVPPGHSFVATVSLKGETATMAFSRKAT